MAEQPGVEPPEPVKWPLEIEIAPTFEDLWRHLEQLRKALSRVGMSDRWKDRAILILEELLTNVLKYGGAGNPSFPIRLTLSGDGSDLWMRLSSAGAPFDPRVFPAPNDTQALADRKIGGLGLLLVNQLADALEYRHVDGWNHIDVRLVVPPT